jgi:hypothetical protein
MTVHPDDFLSPGSATLNLVFANCPGALPMLRRNGSQRGSPRMLSNSLSTGISDRPGSEYFLAVLSHSKALSGFPQQA